jgi:hypothetical protein
MDDFQIIGKFRNYFQIIPETCANFVIILNCRNLYVIMHYKQVNIFNYINIITKS